MKEIGITTFHKAHNYGAMLQVFALSKKIEEKNKVEIINYYNPKIYNQYKILRPLCKNPITLARNLKEDIFCHRKRKLRYTSFENFIKSKCNLSNNYNSEELIKSKSIKYNVLITGSDQVWNPKIVGELSDIYTLNFGTKDIKRISYAASIGNAAIISENENEFKKKLAIIDNISVREEDAKIELEKIIDKPIDVVLDPTLLLRKEEWEKEINDLNKEKEKYILAYVVEHDEEYIKIVNDLSEKTGLKVIHFGLKNPGYNNLLKSAYVDGPLEFVDLIRNAEYVVATSFHATVFSIIFNKKFFIIPHRKTGARVTNLLNKLGITGRTFSSLEEFKNIDYNFETDWSAVEKKLEEERQKSLNWLKNAIEG